MKSLIYIAIVLFLGIIFSCKKDLQTVSKEMSLDEFDTLQLRSVFEVYLIQGTENKIRIEGAKKMVNDIDATISNNTLKLKNNFKQNWLYPKSNKIKLYITVNQISKIYAIESCHIESMNALTGNEIGLVMASKYNEANLELNCNTFYYWNNFPCGGRINLKGQVNELKIWNVALMAVETRELSCNYALVYNGSKGDCIVNCAQKLTYKISGSGNIQVFGSPAVIEKVESNGEGQLIINQ
jgi:Putative auto-transporter adhesin, head GIN domain